MIVRLRDDWPLLAIGAALIAVWCLAHLREAGIL